MTRLRADAFIALSAAATAVALAGWRQRRRGSSAVTPPPRVAGQARDSLVLRTAVEQPPASLPLRRTPVEPPPVDGKPSQSGVYPGWGVALGACLSLGMIFGATLWGFGLLIEPLEREFGWHRWVIAAAVTFTLLISGATSPLVGRLVDKFQPRLVIAVGSVGAALGFVLLSRVTNLWQFLVLLVIISFFRAWIDYVPFTTMVARWFPARRGTAMGIATAGFSMGGLLFLPVMAEIVSAWGWRTSFLAIAVMIIAVNGTFVALFSNRPPRKWSSYGIVAGREEGDEQTHGLLRFSALKETYRSSGFWLASAGFALFFCAQWAFVFHAVPLFGSAGFSPRAASIIVGASAGVGIIARIVFGALIDRARRLELLGAAMLLLTVCALAPLMAGVTPAAVGIFIVFWGVGTGIGELVEPMVVSRLFGLRSYGSVYGAIDGVETIAGSAGPALGVLALELTGSYNGVLGLDIAMLLLAACCLFLLTALARRRARAAEVVRYLRAA